MKIILSFMLIAFFSVIGFANVTSDQRNLLNHSSASGPKVQLGDVVNQTQNLLVAKYSYSVLGGSSATDIKLVTDLNYPKSYATLPVNAIITNAWIDTNVAAGSTGSNTTMALYIKSAGDLVAAGKTTIGPWATLYQYQALPILGTTTSWIRLNGIGTGVGSSTVKLRLALGKLVQGKFNVYIQYVLGGTTTGNF